MGMQTDVVMANLDQAQAVADTPTPTAEAGVLGPIVSRVIPLAGAPSAGLVRRLLRAGSAGARLSCGRMQLNCHRVER